MLVLNDKCFCTSGFSTPTKCIICCFTNKQWSLPTRKKNQTLLDRLRNCMLISIMTAQRDCQGSSHLTSESHDSPPYMFISFNILKKLFPVFKFFVDFRERMGKRKRNVNLLLHLFMHSLVNSYIYPHRGSNPGPWPIGTSY